MWGCLNSLPAPCCDVRLLKYSLQMAQQAVVSAPIKMIAWLLKTHHTYTDVRSSSLMYTHYSCFAVVR